MKTLARWQCGLLCMLAWLALGLLNVAIAAPTVSLDAPIGGVTYTAPASVTLNATAAETGGTITKVEFYNGATLLGTSTIQPYSYTWSDVAVGSYALTAKAYDSLGASATSSSVNITVSAVPPAGETIWVDDAIPTGASLNSDGGDNWTWITNNPTPYSGTQAHQSVVATGEHQHYFTGTPAAGQLSVNVGDKLFAYVYLDPANPPSEIMLQGHASTNSWEHRAYWGTDNIPFGTSGTVSRAYMGALPAVGQWVRLEVPASQVGLEGSKLDGMAFTLFNGRATWDRIGKTSNSTVIPTVALTAPTANQTYTAPASVTLNATAAETGGIITKVEFYNGATLLGTSTIQPYSYTWGSVAVGSYALTAKAYDSLGTSATSSPVNITVSAASNPPTVALTAPTANQTYTAPASVTLNATAAETGGTISRVDFYNGVNLLGAATVSPYSYTWNNVAAGSYSFTAVATDIRNVSVTSSSVNVSVVAPAIPVVTYFHNDAAGTPLAATDASGNLLWKENYSPYGNRQLNAPVASANNKLWFTGKPYDPLTQLTYMGARYYDPVLGRFMGIDPVEFKESNIHSFNRYAYGNNNPYKFVDPDGRDPISSIATRVAKLTADGIVGVGNLIARRGWRKSEKQAIEDASVMGPKGGKICPDCKNEVDKLDINHAGKKWGETQHEILDTVEQGGKITRAEVRDLYGKNIDGKCPGCNRADNKLSVGSASTGAAAGILGTGVSWGDVRDFAVDFIVPGGVSGTGGCSGGRCSDTIDGR